MILPQNSSFKISVGIRYATDFSPFGVELKGRNFEVVGGGNYRYSFQGQETDSEVKGEGNSVNYKYRMHDPRLGRFFAVDPLSYQYPHNSPYAFSENRVIDGIELEGLERYYTADGKLIGKYGTNTEIRIVHENSLEAAKNITSNQNLPESDVLNTVLFNSGSHGVFQSNEEASIDLAKNINPISIEQNREYGSSLYELEIDGQKHITYTESVRGTVTRSDPDDSPIPEGTSPTGFFHSHGGFDVRLDSDIFSKGDKKWARRHEMDVYMSTPSGTCQKYDYKCQIESVISTEIPSDPKDPERVNNIEANKPLPIIIKN